MGLKGICPECGEVVNCGKLVIGKNSGIKMKTDGKPAYLTSIHPPKKGCRVDRLIDIATEKVAKTNCFGSMRPPRTLVH